MISCLCYYIEFKGLQSIRIKIIYYINSSDISGDLSCLKLIFSHFHEANKKEDNLWQKFWKLMF